MKYAVFIALNQCHFSRHVKDCSEFATHLIDLIELAYETMGKR